MASGHRQVLQLLAAAAIAVAFLPAPASAVDYRVGDDAGWTLNYFIGWPVGKTFNVGDNLVFKYNVTIANHTVTEVDGQTFKECYKQGNMIKEWKSGNDTVKLDKPGRRWFFCSVADHCELGLKLVVDVIGPEAPSPAPPGPPAASPPPSPPPPPPPSTSSPWSSSAASTKNYVSAGEAVARAMVMAGAVVLGVIM